MTIERAQRDAATAVQSDPAEDGLDVSMARVIWPVGRVMTGAVYRRCERGRSEFPESEYAGVPNRVEVR